MATGAPFANLMTRLAQGDGKAATAVWERFARRLTALAAKRLPVLLQAKTDRESVVLSVLQSFFTRQQDARIGQRRPALCLFAQVALHLFVVDGPGTVDVAIGMPTPVAPAKRTRSQVPSFRRRAARCIDNRVLATKRTISIVVKVLVGSTVRRGRPARAGQGSGFVLALRRNASTSIQSCCQTAPSVMGNRATSVGSRTLARSASCCQWSMIC
jgi:hypothetical protein